MKENAKKPRKLSKFQQRYEEMMKQRKTKGQKEITTAKQAIPKNAGCWGRGGL